MRHCPTCGIELPDTARFCSHCGETLIAPATIDRSTHTTQMNNSQPADAQLRDVSAVPTQQLINHAEQEQVLASRGTLSGGQVMINHTDSPLPEELQSQSNSHPTGKDEQQHDTSLSDLPQMEAPVGNGHSSAEGEPIAQAEPPVSPPQGRRGVIKGRTGVMNHAPTTHWLIIALIILVLIAGSPSPLVFLQPISPAP